MWCVIYACLEKFKSYSFSIEFLYYNKRLFDCKDCVNVMQKGCEYFFIE
jgi:hypothetical protein